MLDLTVVCGSMYEIKMLDGKILKLKRPTQRLYESIIALGEKTNKDFDSSLLGAAMDLFVEILNRNSEGIAFDRKALEKDYDFSVALLVMNDYMRFYANEIGTNVNFQPAQ